MSTSAHQAMSLLLRDILKGQRIKGMELIEPHKPKKESKPIKSKDINLKWDEALASRRGRRKGSRVG